MINVTEEIQSKFLTDSTPKQLVVEFENDETDLSAVNWYTGDINEAGYGYSVNHDGTGSSASAFAQDLYAYKFGQDIMPYINFDYADYCKYMYISVNFQISYTNHPNIPNGIALAVRYRTKNPSADKITISAYDYNVRDFIENSEGVGGKRLYCELNVADLESIVHVSVYFLYGTSKIVNMAYGISRYQIDFSNKYYDTGRSMSISILRNLFPYKGESILRKGVNPISYIKLGTTPIDPITNNDLEAESFTLVESLCSENNLKFGACEASYCEFSTVDRTENIKDRYITPYFNFSGISDIGPSVSSISWINLYNGLYPAPMGSITYTRSGALNTKWTICTSASSIQSINTKYLNIYSCVCVSFKVRLTQVDFSDTVPDLLSLKIRFYTTDSKLHSWYFPVNSAWTKDQITQFTIDELIGDYVICKFYIPLDKSIVDPTGVYAYDISSFYDIEIDFVTSTNTQYTSEDGNAEFKIQVTEMQANIVSQYFDPIPEYNIADMVEYMGGSLDKYFYIKKPMPLGRFKISEIKKSHTYDFYRRTITAYDDLVKLEQNAADWYTLYMYALSFNDYESRYGFEFARQIYSTYFNLMTNLGLENRDYYTEVEIYSYDLTTTYPRIPLLVNKFSQWESEPIPPSGSENKSRLHYIKITMDNVDPTKRYVVDLTQHLENFTVAEYTAQADEYLRGVKTANVLIEETRTGDYADNSFVVDSGDYFMISPTCTSFNIYVPAVSYLTKLGFDSGLFTYTVKVSEVQEPIELENGWIRLMYYNYVTQDIFPCESSITARDAIRSLLEVTGCFLKMDRYGKPAFKYCTKAGLYPSNTLYPRDDLYPRGLDGDILPRSKYISLECEDYEIKNYGKIQIVKKQKSNEAKSICEWQYVGDKDSINTYIIDDNIFYCSDEMKYEYDSMPEVAEMLENMYNRISNMGYTPNITQAPGMPYLECGDRIAVITKHGGMESFIFRRTLKGIQGLRDTYESEGDEYTEAIKDFGYIEWSK